MATLATNISFQCLGLDGKPLAGGKVYTYEAGTTTPKSTYTTMAGDVPNSNPVILDQNGKAKIFLGDGAYRMRILDSNDALIDDINQISRYVTQSEFASFQQAVQEGVDQLTEVREQIDVFVSTSIGNQKGFAGGIVPLDANVKIDPIYLPVQSSTYTKLEVDSALALKAPQATTYTKTEVDSILSTKAPQSNTYTKAEVDTTFAAYAGGRKAYTTLALAQAAQSSLPANTAIEVTNDGANNGTYQWNGTTLTKSNYDPLTQAKNYTNSINSITNKLRSSLVNFDEFPLSTDQFVTFQKLGSRLRIFCAPNTGIILAEWRADASDFTTGKFSAQITLSAFAGSGGTIAVKQYDANNTLLVTTNMVTSLTSAITDQTYSVNNISINALTAFIGIEVNLLDATNKARIASIASVVIADGAYVGVLPVIQNFLPKINVFPSPSLSKSKATLFNATASNGVLTMEGAAQQEATFDLQLNDIVRVSSYITFSADIFTDAVGKADLSLQCFDSSNVLLNTNIVIANTQINVWEKAGTRVIVPAGTAYVRFRFVKRTGTSLAQFKSVMATSSDAFKAITLNAFADSAGGGAYNVIYMASTGNDNNDGKAKSSPVATLRKAVSLAAPRGQIVIAEGDYEFDTLGAASWAGVSELSIEAERNARVRFISNNKLTGITKTAGYTKVYQAPLSASGWNPPRGNWIWHHDAPDPRTLIAASDRMALQRGQTHRLLSTKIEKVASIAAIEAATVPSWYHNTANNTIYFSIWNGANAVGADIRIPSSQYFALYGGTGTEKIKLTGIDVLYAGSTGFGCQRLVSIEMKNCRSMFNKDNGVSFDDSKFIVTRYNEYAGNEWDGGNVHCYQPNTYQMPVVYQAYDTWSHDNGDDGDSMHEICLGTYWGGLYEYNGDRGIATAFGAHSDAHNTMARYNGQIDQIGGEGFAALGTLATDTGVGTQFNCYNCVAIGNRYNYSATEATSLVNAYNCLSRDATVAGYRAVAGAVNAYDCKTLNDAVAKTGTVNIMNSTTLI